MNAFDEDAAPEPMDAAVSRRGDVWLLGAHRLMCGDSSVAADVDVLLAGARIQLVNTDPPYNVKVEPRSANAIAAGHSSFGGMTHHQSFDAERGAVGATTGKLRPKDRPLLNDFLPEAEFERLLLAWFGNFARVMDDGAAFYIWGGYANCANYPTAMKASGLYFSQALIWVKGHPVLTRKDFMGAHEWCFYGWKEGRGPQVLRAQQRDRTCGRSRRSAPQKMVHFTEKPVELAVRAIEYSSRPGEHVLDFFGGSGSTLMGAEHTGRKAFLMELDPSYVDVIVRRFEQATGKKATLEATGRTFEQVIDQRGAS
jgi:DNA modification methylase